MHAFVLSTYLRGVHECRFRYLVGLSVINVPFYFSALLSLSLLVDDVNANPNKRQRQPALLGDHPPEYGKALRLHMFEINQWGS